MAGVSPTQNTLKWMRKHGLTSQVVEHWNPHARIRQDLYGIIDVLGVGEGRTVAVQSTSWSNLSARMKKMQEAEILGTLCDAGWVVIAQGWQKRSNRWTSRQFLITPDDRRAVCSETMSLLPP